MKKNQAEVDAGEAGDAVYGVMLASLQAALAMGRPADFFRYLERGANPNNVTGGRSLISFTMERSLSLLERRAPNDVLSVYTGATSKLIDYGADLSHRPFDHNGRPAALHDPQLWREPRFGAAVILQAMDYALNNQQPVPRLEISGIDGRYLYAPGSARAADQIQRAFSDVAMVQREVYLRLDETADPLAKRVAGKLPQEEREFWRGAVASAGSLLRFNS